MLCCLLSVYYQLVSWNLCNFPIPCPEYLKGLFPVPGWTGSGRLLHAAVSGNRSAAIGQMISDQAPAPALMVQLECSAAELCAGKCHNAMPSGSLKMTFSI